MTSQKKIEMKPLSTFSELLFKRIEKMARRLAAWLSNRSETLRPGAKKAILCCFCILSSGACLWIMLGKFHKWNNNILNKPQQQTIPLSGQRNYQPPKPAISTALYQRIEDLKSNDSLMRCRPKLKDSIMLIEKYYSQFKKY